MSKNNLSFTALTEEQIMWHLELPMRVLHAMAYADSYNIQVSMTATVPGSETTVRFYFTENDLGYEEVCDVKITDHPSTCTSKDNWDLYSRYLLSAIEHIEIKRAKEQVRKTALAKLTPEEKEALGL